MDNQKILSTHGIYETHLAVDDRAISVDFYHNTLGLKIAREIDERDITFFWVDDSMTGMLGIWGKDCPNPPVSGRGHFAFSVDLDFIKEVPQFLKDRDIPPLDIDGNPTDEPVVISWMPAVSVYFKDPDGHSIEFIHPLEVKPRPDLGTIPLSHWESL